jgi:hypothetical protein
MDKFCEVCGGEIPEGTKKAEIITKTNFYKGNPEWEINTVTCLCGECLQSKCKVIIKVGNEIFKEVVL